MRCLVWEIVAVGVACTSEVPHTGPTDAGGTVVGRFAGSETLTARQEVSREAARFLPALREQFETLFDALLSRPRQQRAVALVEPRGAP